MNYQEWFNHMIEEGNDLENGFIETRQEEFNAFCLEEYKNQEVEK